MRSLILSLLVLVTLLNASEENPTKEEVAKLYVATFNRAPDAGGLNYWMYDSFDGKATLSNIASSFFDQPETKDTYPDGTSYRDFIQSIYANLFNREPDTGGWNYWESELGLGKIPKNLFIIAVINGALDNEDGLDKTILTNKMRVGLSFSQAGLSNKDDARTIMAGVTALADSITSAVNQFGIDLYTDTNIPPVGNEGVDHGWKVVVTGTMTAYGTVNVIPTYTYNISSVAVPTTEQQIVSESDGSASINWVYTNTTNTSTKVIWKMNGNVAAHGFATDFEYIYTYTKI